MLKKKKNPSVTFHHLWEKWYTVPVMIGHHPHLLLLST